MDRADILNILVDRNETVPAAEATPSSAPPDPIYTGSFVSHRSIGLRSIMEWTSEVETMDPESIDMKIEGLRNAGDALDERMEELIALGATALEPLIVAIEEAAADEDADWRYTDALSNTVMGMTDPVALPRLIDALGHPCERVRQAVSGALSNEYVERAFEPLSALLSDTGADPTARRTAADWFAGIASTAYWHEILTSGAGVFRAHLDNAETDVRVAMVHTLGYLADPADLDTLIALLDSEDRSLRTAAASALGRFGSAAERAVPALVALLERPAVEKSEVQTLVTALNLIGDDRALPALERLCPTYRGSYLELLFSQTIEKLGTGP